ncbi:MAG: sensor histidine kinase [Nitrospirota bacterium]
MPNTSRSTAVILIAGAVVIALAAVLFANALILGEFGLPGQGFLAGRSTVRLAAAFALLAGLAIALLARTARTAGAASGVRRVREKADSTRVRSSAGTALSVDGPENAGASAGILSETAGELRTSVDVIQEELGEILEDEAPADKEHMHALYEETDRLKKIIEGMEQLSRAQAIARSLKPEPLQVEPLLADIIERTRQAVTDKEVAYTLECEPGLVLQADRECISRIIGNITDNAARFIKGTGTVTLTAGRSGGFVVFSVRDTGTGIRRAHRSHLYERFFRGAGSGIGIGLSIVKELVDACRGAIEVQTEVGKGTTVTVKMPGE